MDTEPAPDTDSLLELYRVMFLIRTFEEEAGKLSEKGVLPGFIHLYVGQEAVAVGVMSQLRREDQITSTHRGHGHLIAKGGDVRLMFAELYAKQTGYCHGKGGSMHICDPELGILGSNGIVAAGIPIAVGAAFSDKYRRTDNVSVSFFGDGASNEGAFHEALNMAALYQLPCVFVCENNLYGEFTAQHRHQTVLDIADRARGYGFPGMVVDGMDVLAVRAAAREAVDRARSGGGPTLVECKTYRFYDHVGVNGMGPVYRQAEEVLEWRKKDPITQLESRIAELGIDQDHVHDIQRDVTAEVERAIRFAEESPDADPATLLDDVYSQPFSI